VEARRTWASTSEKIAEPMDLPEASGSVRSRSIWDSTLMPGGARRRRAAPGEAAGEEFCEWSRFSASWSCSAGTNAKAPQQPRYRCWTLRPHTELRIGAHLANAVDLLADRVASLACFLRRIHHDLRRLLHPQSTTPQLCGFRASASQVSSWTRA
jgi:hypothetical protein